MEQHTKIYNKTGKQSQLLKDADRLPSGTEFVWNLFNELSLSRDWHEGQPSAIKPTEVAAHSSLTNTRLSPVEFKLLSVLDSTYRSTINGD